MRAPIILTALLLSTTINAGIFDVPTRFADIVVAEGLELKSNFQNQVRKYTAPGRALVMLNTDGRNKDSYRAVIKDGKLIITAKDDSLDASYRTFSYETSLPDDINGTNIKLSFKDDILIVEI
jgi:hypothetical protein